MACGLGPERRPVRGGRRDALAASSRWPYVCKEAVPACLVGEQVSRAVRPGRVAHEFVAAPASQFLWTRALQLMLGLLRFFYGNLLRRLFVGGRDCCRRPVSACCVSGRLDDVDQLVD